MNQRNDRGTTSHARPGGAQQPHSASGGNLEHKRARFEQAGRFPLRKLIIACSVLTLFAAAGSVAWWRIEVSKRVSSGVFLDKTAVTPSSAAGATEGESAASVPMTPIELTVNGNTASFELADVQSRPLVSMTYPRKAPMPGDWEQITGGELPLIAYVSPSGNLVVATSFCEPCRSIRFHLEGETLVCDACFTRWDLNTLEGESGGCTAYPPQPLTAKIQGGKIIVNTGDLEKWEPRV